MAIVMAITHTQLSGNLSLPPISLFLSNPALSLFLYGNCLFLFICLAFPILLAAIFLLSIGSQHLIATFLYTLSSFPFTCCLLSFPALSVETAS